MTGCLREDQLDIIGQLFGFRFVEGCSNGCVELYIEDDGYWHKQVTFDQSWLKDLHWASGRAMQKANMGKTRAKGGHARAKALSPERRKEIAVNAARSRWGNA